MTISGSQLARKVLRPEFDKDYMKRLKAFWSKNRNSIVFIHRTQSSFRLLTIPPFDKVRVVILGQDPYHGPGEAHGLSFSVKKGVRIPPSLRNIYKELQSDLGMHPPSHGYLIDWAKQGVLLLNRSHSSAQNSKLTSKGWETFTDKAIQELSASDVNIVFILWGSKAKAKLDLIDQSKHHIIQSAHPSPLAVRYGFFGSKPFSKTNAFLTSIGQSPIDWTLSE